MNPIDWSCWSAICRLTNFIWQIVSAKWLFIRKLTTSIHVFERWSARTSLEFMLRNVKNDWTVARWSVPDECECNNLLSSTVFFRQFYFNTMAQNGLLYSVACFGSGFINFWGNFFFLRLNRWSSWTTVIVWVCWACLSFWVSDIFGLNLFSLITCRRSTGEKFFLWRVFLVYYVKMSLVTLSNPLIK